MAGQSETRVLLCPNDGRIRHPTVLYQTADDHQRFVIPHATTDWRSTDDAQRPNGARRIHDVHRQKATAIPMANENDDYEPLSEVGAQMHIVNQIIHDPTFPKDYP